MTAENEKRTAESIFYHASQIDDQAAKNAFLAKVCDGDPRLREEVEELLVANDRTDSFFDAGVEFARMTTNRNSKTTVEGANVGRYKLLQQLGEGGFGVVFMAEQVEPIRRKVALKIIKPGMDSKAVVARFEAERQALAMMDHPHIARILDGGTTNEDQPYFVMELVRGVSITEYSDKKRLSSRERLRLFIDVCHAVQHAHQKSIIHRDIKPSNVMITLHDGIPVVKVIDFGVSKALNQQLTEKTLFTRYGQMIGTPQYMSPEQAEMSGLDVDTRSDIYSLGVLLYELLIGTPPITSDRLRSAGFGEMRRIICDEETTRPSNRLSTTDEQELLDIAEHRGVSTKELRKELSGDLEWIVMKALEKDRNRRYESSSAFADDLVRFLSNEPVTARRPSTAYRMRKALVRNKLFVGGVALLISAFAISTLAISLAYRNVSSYAIELNKSNAQVTTALSVAEKANQALTGQVYIAEMMKASHAMDIGDLERLRESLDAAGELNSRRTLEQRFFDACYEQLLPDLGKFPGWEVSANAEGDEFAFQTANHLNIRRISEAEATSVLQRTSKASESEECSGVGFAHDGNSFVVKDFSSSVISVYQRTADDWSTNQRNIDCGFPVATCDLSNDGSQLLAGGEKTIGVWSVDTGDPLWTIAQDAWLAGGSVAGSNYLRFAGNSQFVIDAGRHEVRIRDAANGELISSQRLMSASRTLRVSPDSRTIAVGGIKPSLWTLTKQGKLLLRHRFDLGIALAFAFSPDGQVLAVGDRQRIYLYDVSDDRPRYQCQFMLPRVVYHLAITRDDVLLASGDDDGMIWSWNIAKVGHRGHYSGNNQWFLGLAVTDDLIAFSNSDNEVMTWSSRTNTTRKVAQHSDVVNTLAFSNDGSKLYAAGAGQVTRHDLTSDGESHTLLADVGIGLASHQNRFVVASSRDGKLRLLDEDLSDGRWKELVGYSPQSRISRVVFPPSVTADYFVTVGSDAENDEGTRFWDISSGKCIASLRHPGHCYAAAFSPDGKTLAIAVRRGAIEFYEVDAGETFAVRRSEPTLRATPFFVQSMTFNQDGTRLVTGSPNGMIRFWRVSDGAEVGRFNTRETIREIAFRPNFRELVTASQEGWIRIWPIAAQ